MFAALAAIGLEAIAAIEADPAPNVEWSGHAKALLERLAAADKASENIIHVVTTDQPPAISITPGVRRLVDAAASRRR